MCPSFWVRWAFESAAWVKAGCPSRCGWGSASLLKARVLWKALSASLSLSRDIGFLYSPLSLDLHGQLSCVWTSHLLHCMSQLPATSHFSPFPLLLLSLHVRPVLSVSLGNPDEPTVHWFSVATWKDHQKLSGSNNTYLLTCDSQESRKNCFLQPRASEDGNTGVTKAMAMPKVQEGKDPPPNSCNLLAEFSCLWLGTQVLQFHSGCWQEIVLSF